MYQDCFLRENLGECRCADRVNEGNYLAPPGLPVEAPVKTNRKLHSPAEFPCRVISAPLFLGNKPFLDRIVRLPPHGVFLFSM